MSAPPPASSWAAPPEFYIDENLSGKTLRRFVADLGYRVHTPAEVFGRVRLDESLSDEDWLPIVGANDWVVFGRDKRILDRELELHAYRQAKVHMFLLPGELARAGIIALMTVNLRDVCALAVARRPNVYWLTAHGIVPYESKIGVRQRRRDRPGG